MAILISSESEYGKELWKWEHTQAETMENHPEVRGMRPVGFQPYPAMMYKATQQNPWRFEQHVVNSELEQRNMESRGFYAGGQQVAADAFKASEQALAVAAAERNYQDRNMGEKARAESDRAEQASSVHLGEIPRTPVKKRVRRTNAQIAADKAAKAGL